MTAQPVEAVEAVEVATLFAVYDNPEQTIERVYESQRDCQAFCDEWNSYLGWDRYVVEPVPAHEWGDEQVRWA